MVARKKDQGKGEDQAAPARRVDVFSVKGGVGKTTVSYLLARAQARISDRPVLLIDADLTGTCVGDLLDEGTEPTWDAVLNLAHLICDRPESLPERLERRSLPVYVHEPGRASGSEPARIHQVAAGVAGRVVYCPSHADSVLPRVVDREVLQALIGHETAGGWVRHVLARVIAVTEQVSGGLGGVIVDHAPGVAALQSMTLEDIRQVQRGRSAANPTRRAVMMTTCDRVDLKMCRAFHAREARRIRRATTWVVNRVMPGWREQPGFQDEFGDESWLQPASSCEIGYDVGLRDAYMRSALAEMAGSGPGASSAPTPGDRAGIAAAIEGLRRALFEDG